MMEDLQGKACTTEEEARLFRFLETSVGHGHEVQRILPLEGDASDRRYFRIHVKHHRGSISHNYVVMMLDKPWQGEKGMEELPFINIARHLTQVRIPVPEIYNYDSDHGMLLLEDLGEITLQKLLQGRPWTEQRGYYYEAISLLESMQTAEDLFNGCTCYAMQRAFDAETFFSELLFFLEHAVEGLWRQRITAADRKELEAQFWTLCQQIAPVANVFTHRDYHSRNLMVKEGRLRILDFQDARMGTIYYDLASLLRDSYIGLPEEAVVELLGYYRERGRNDAVSTIDRHSFSEAFDRTSIQRNLKACGTFAYQASKKGRDHYLNYIPRTLGYVRSNLAKYKDLKDLKKILGEYVEELR
jgi:aminoglycoside/choline kinase family phosphotransferase